ncbi:hypothetical protein AAE478_002644 [Parahypoxylon ruwenzoriense]
MEVPLKSPQAPDLNAARMSSKLPGILTHVYSMVLVLVSILLLAFKSTAFNSYMDQTDDGKVTTTVVWPGHGLGDYIQLYPYELFPVVQGPVIAAASVGLITSLAVAALSTWALRSRRVLKLNQTQRLMVLAVLCANALLATIVMIFELVQRGRSIHFDPEYRMTESAAYDKGPFTLEIWTCEAPVYVSSFERYGLRKQCVGERASLCLLIVMWVFSSAMLGCLAWDMRSAQSIVTAKKRAVDWEDDGWD